jgi:hypothetical protein
MVRFWPLGACAEGVSVGDPGEDVGDIEVELGGGPDGLECGVGGEDAGDLSTDGYPVSVEHLLELGPSLYRWMRVVVAGRQGFRVQPEDRAELGAVDAGVADESKQFHKFLE